jgi:ubiquitin-protein ligase E3 C
VDPELYKSLMFLKTYAGDVADLSLTFTAATELGAAGDEAELVPGGAGMAVTDANRLRYVFALAQWRLSASIARQRDAFVRGLRDVLPPHWLAPFSAPELQVLLSGAQRGVDVDDLRAHAAYAGGLWVRSDVVAWLWETLASWSAADRAKVLAFVTAAQRPPPNGFAFLSPPFTVVHLAPPPGTRADDMLPCASTCFNQLKLPSYSSKKALAAKLRVAIESGTGFELT